MSDTPFTFVNKNGKSFSFVSGLELSNWYQSQKSRKKKKKKANKTNKPATETNDTGVDSSNA